MAERRLAGRVAIVTGGARGIGQAIARRFVAEGASVVVADVDGEVAAATARELGPAGAAIGHALDITVPDQAAATVALAEERWGRLDILVNNAAILDASPFDQLTRARFSEVLRVNLEGALLCTMAAVPALARTGGGRILNIASIMGIAGSRDSIPYSTAKGGLVNLTRCLACDLAERNITVNAIAPGFIDTRMAVTREGVHEHQTEHFKTVYLKYGKIPLGRAGTPEDIAGPAFFLCSDDARYVTGQILVVDGGVTMTF
ncbi:MAG TPA: SDR family NAD(P)-dependent oxidoreductase [Geminicoccaceae bacterium]|nr:SDR family NAD(P)-dependent oxidoreductase [Geminicoccaceae bacterium]